MYKRQDLDRAELQKYLLRERLQDNWSEISRLRGPVDELNTLIAVAEEQAEIDRMFPRPKLSVVPTQAEARREKRSSIFRQESIDALKAMEEEWKVQADVESARLAVKADRRLLAELVETNSRLWTELVDNLTTITDQAEKDTPAPKVDQAAKKKTPGRIPSELYDLAFAEIYEGHPERKVSKKRRDDAVSYTHLTLPTSDLV